MVSGAPNTKGNHKEYLTMMAGAHRRKVTPLGSPSLVRHQAFWKPLETGGGLTDHVAWRNQRCGNVDDVILSLFRTLKTSDNVSDLHYGGPLSKEDKREAPAREAPLFACSMDCENGAKVLRPGAQFDSYRSIKLNFLWSGFSMTISFEVHIEFTTVTTIIDLSDREKCKPLSVLRAKDPLHKEIVASLRAISAAKPAHREKHRALYNSVYFRVWQEFDKDILKKIDLSCSLGPRFLEFRGLVVEPAKSRSLIGSSLFTAPYRQIRWQSGFDKHHESKCSLVALERVHPFLKCTLSDNTEFTVSTLLDKRAYFAASLGLQSFVDEQAEPFTYFVYEDTLNAWQLGRVIYRINRAGTARIAATMHFDSLRKAGDTLLAAANQLDVALTEPAGGDDATRAGLLKSTEKIRTFHRKVEAAIADLPEAKDLDGSLHYRIDRSEYYQSQFRRVTKSLRMDRVEGYQQYDEFVGQRLGPAYEYIARLGKMYARVQSDRSLLLRRLQAQDALFEEKQISRFQETAEIALFLVLGPYYAGSVFTHIFPATAAERPIWVGFLIWGWSSWLFDSQWRKAFPTRKRRLLIFMAIGGILALAAGYAVYRLHSAEAPPPEPQISPHGAAISTGTALQRVPPGTLG